MRSLILSVWLLLAAGSGLALDGALRAQLDRGERNPDVLACMRDVRCRESVETIRAALVGNYQPEHVFALAQALSVDQHLIALFHPRGQRRHLAVDLDTAFADQLVGFAA